MDKINAIVTLEVLGRPAKNVTDSLKSITERIGAEKGVKILNKTIHPPKAIPESKDLFTSFAEVEMEFDSLHNYFGVVFAYLPSHIELIYPETIPLGNFDLNALANQIIQRLHSYDAIAKKMIFEKDALQNKLMEVAPHLFKQPEQPQQPQQKSPPIKKSKVKKSSKKKK